MNEKRLAFLRVNYEGRLREKFPSLDGPIVDHVAACDPDKTKRNTQWLLTCLLRGGIGLEDLGPASELLGRFEGLRNVLPPDLRDLNRYRTLPDLDAAIEPFMGRKSKRAEDRGYEQQMLAECDILLDNAEYRVASPRTREAAAHLGINTKWCTTLDPRAIRDFWGDYTRDGDLYVVLQKPTNKRWMFYPSGAQYKHEDDTRIDLTALLAAHPVIAKLFEEIDTKREVVGEIGRVRFLKTRDGLEVKRGLGLGRTLATFRAEDGLITSATSLLAWPGVFDKPQHGPKLAGVLNRTGLQPRPDTQVYHLAASGCFWNGRWGTLAEVGTPSISYPDGATWVSIRGSDLRYPTTYRVWNALLRGGEVLMRLDVVNGRALVEAPADPAAWTYLPNGLKDAAITSLRIRADIPAEIRARIAAERPELGTK